MKYIYYNFLKVQDQNKIKIRVRYRTCKNKQIYNYKISKRSRPEWTDMFLKAHNKLFFENQTCTRYYLVAHSTMVMCPYLSPLSKFFLKKSGFEFGDVE